MRVLGQSMEEKNNITSYRYQDLGIAYSISDQYKLIHYNRKQKQNKKTELTASVLKKERSKTHKRLEENDDEDMLQVKQDER